MFHSYSQKENRRNLKNFYNQSSDFFSATRAYWWRDLTFIKDYYSQDSKLLDFGCGNGRLLKLLPSLKNNPRYTGVDISQKLLAKAQKEYPQNKFIKLKKETDLSFKKNYFDAIFSIAVFHHFNPQTAHQVLQAFHKIMKPDGTLVITAWYLWKKKNLNFLLKSIFSGQKELSAELTFKIQNKKTFYRYCYFWRQQQLQRVIKQNGFEILKSGVTTNQKKNKLNIFVVAKKIK